jgi:hypothetical protein
VLVLRRGRSRRWQETGGRGRKITYRITRIITLRPDRHPRAEATRVGFTYIPTLPGTAEWHGGTSTPDLV